MDPFHVFILNLLLKQWINFDEEEQHVRDRLRWFKRRRALDEAEEEHQVKRRKQDAEVQALVGSGVRLEMVERLWWVKPRSFHWFDRFVERYYDDQRWICIFGMKKSVFNTLVAHLRPSLQKQDTRYRAAVPVRVRVAATIAKLRYGISFFSISENFGIGESSASEIFWETVTAIEVELRHLIKFPTSPEEVARVISGFKQRSKIPNVAGAVDGSQIPIRKPERDPEVYYKHHRHSIVLQAVVDSKRRFLDVYCGWPGSVHDARVWKNSGIFKRGTENRILQEPTFQLRDSTLKPFFVGDKAYPCSPLVITPYKRTGVALSPMKTFFNNELSKARELWRELSAF